MANSIIYSLQITAGISDEANYLSGLFNQQRDIYSDIRFYIRARRNILIYFLDKQTLDSLYLKPGTHLISYIYLIIKVYNRPVDNCIESSFER